MQGDGGCKLTRIEKSFGDTRILAGIDLHAAAGSFAVLVGPSGCGKSTLLRILAGLEDADSGVVSIDGRDVTKLPPRERDVEMVFQSYALYPHLTVRDNLAFGLRLRKTPEAEIATRIGKASSMLGLDPLLARYPKQLSGGQRQRVAMGRAIVRRAKLFLYDEPLSNLDAALRADVRVQIRQLHDQLGATSLYVTHDQVEAMTLADTLWILDKGVVEQSGAPLDVFARPASTFVAKFLGSPPMNLLEGGNVQDATVRGPGFSLDVNRARYATASRAVTVGVRPHELVLEPAAASDGAHVRAEVRFVERLGPESFVHAIVGETKLVARLGAEQADARGLRAGEVVTFTARVDHVHLFDAGTGRALDLAPAAPALASPRRAPELP